MNRPSLEKFAPAVRPGGVILINRSLIPIDAGRDDVDVISIPVTDIANELGSVRSANIVALAAFAARSKLVDKELLKACVKEEFANKEKLIPLNMKAVDAGFKAAEEA